MLSKTKTRWIFVLAMALACASPLAAQAKKPVHSPVHKQAATKPLPPSIEDLEKRTFTWFWESANPANGLVPDHYPADSFASIASVGFGLTAYGVGVERGYITRDQAIDRTLTTLRFFRDAPQNDSEDDATGFHGFYYHFLNMQTGKREARWVELSTVDTTWLMAGVLFAQSYYDRDTPKEKEIRDIADQLYRNVEWSWAQPRAPLISMGWTPGGKFIPHDWKSYDESMLVYILALGSPTHPVSDDAWAARTTDYQRTWGTFYGQEHLSFAPLFGHQYSHVWVDFRGIRDGWSRDKGLDYFENSRRATYAQRAYAVANPGNCTGYGKNVWGLTASNGPGGYVVLGHPTQPQRKFFGYTARGAGIDYIQDDCTIAPTAAGGSIAFAPEIVVPALEEMKKRYGKYIYNKYGFVDAFNPSFHLQNVQLRTGKLVPEMGWTDTVQIGIDQGPIVLMIENWRSNFVWNVMKKNPYIRKGLERAGFTGGWLDGDSKQP
ncbi:MAG TPA: glucoamylase family protein [Dyella sp.]|uniref:glucoamylase family protein n=1 Tax=Dyella sp. TaxID=1869338 RepID=UPI002F94035A